VDRARQATDHERRDDGHGRAARNFENVVPALRLMLDDNAYGLSRRRVTLSTSGIVPLIDRLRDECPVALAVSLHAPERRAARQHRADQPQASAARAHGRMPALPGRRRRAISSRSSTSCSTASTTAFSNADELVALVRDVPVQANLIPFNPFPGSEFRTQPAGAHQRLPEAPHGRRHRDDRAQDARRTTSRPRAASSRARVQDRTKRRLATRIVPVAAP
jgi:23S rRNA (adenine2503-C2)-methyltransferase